MHRQPQLLRLALDMPARESGLPHQFLDDAPALLKATVVLGAHVGVVLNQPFIFELRSPSPLGSASEAEFCFNGRAALPAFFDVPPQLTQVMAVLPRGGIETRKLRAKPIIRFLSVPPVAHSLAVTQALLPDVFRSSPLLAAVRLRLEGRAVLRAGGQGASADVFVQLLQILGFGRLPDQYSGGLASRYYAVL